MLLTLDPVGVLPLVGSWNSQSSPTVYRLLAHFSDIMAVLGMVLLGTLVISQAVISFPWGRFLWLWMRPSGFRMLRWRLTLFGLQPY